jgi:PAS domain S-box-containing protein
VSESSTSQSLRGDSLANPLPAARASLESILCTEELRRRPSRRPDYEKENRALVALAHALADSPRTLLQTLADTILEVCESDSAGISLLTTDDGGKRFYWPAIAGKWKPHIGGGTPRDFGPCGDVLDRNTPLLMRHVESRYTYFQPVTPPVEEVLLVPFYVKGEAVGTIWAVAHDERRRFDAEDERIMRSLGNFASSAYQILESLEQRQASERTLRENELRFREMIDALPVPIYTTDALGRLTHFNPAAAEFSGRMPELGTDQWCVSWKLYWADGSPMSHDECPMAVALKEGRIVSNVEAIAERPDGKRIRFVPYPTPLRDADGRIVGGINMLLDITERKQVERANALLAAIVDSSDDAIVSKTLDGVITSWNKGAERIFGYLAEEAIGQHITLIIPQDRLHEEADILQRLRRGEQIDHFDTVRVRKDGKPVDISVTISPVKDAQGRVTGGSKVARDVTQRKQTERTLAENEERFRALADQLDAQVKVRTLQLEHRNAEVLNQSVQLRELSQRLMRTQDNERRHIARELHDSAGQILAALGMNLATVATEARKDAPRLVSAAEEGEQLVQKLSQEIRTMSYLLHPPLLDENGLPEALRWYSQGLTERSGLDISLNIPEDFGRLSPELELVMFRLVQECLTNIHRHSGSKKAVIRMAHTAESVSLEVEDDGSGISPEKLVEIQSQGSGVGIAGMRERVRQLEGDMSIQSDASGTMICFIFPVPRTASSKVQTIVPQVQAAG